MGLFNVSLFSSQISGIHTERQQPSRIISSQMRFPAEAAELQPVKGCRDRIGEAEYQHLVELGHWHHRRQRRRSRR